MQFRLLTTKMRLLPFNCVATWCYMNPDRHPNNTSAFPRAVLRNMNTGSSAGYRTSPEPQFMMWQFIVNCWRTSHWTPSCADSFCESRCNCSPAYVLSFSTLMFAVMDLPKVNRPPVPSPDPFQGDLLHFGLHGLTAIVQAGAIAMALQNKIVELF